LGITEKRLGNIELETAKVSGVNTLIPAPKLEGPIGFRALELEIEFPDIRSFVCDLSESLADLLATASRDDTLNSRHNITITKAAHHPRVLSITISPKN
jgi:hypothetical protein